MKKDVTYWNDYSVFIKTAEEFTGISPAALLERYKILIEELQNKEYLEWIYERMEKEYTVTQIHKLINLKSLEQNLLNKNFTIEIELLDEIFKKFLKESCRTKEAWWVDFAEEQIIW